MTSVGKLENTLSHTASTSSQPASAIPPDDKRRQLTVIDPDNQQARHVSVAGDTYTILLSGVETAGRYCLIDMYVPPQGGPPPHRHDFEEVFTLLDGELEFTFRGETSTVKAGSTVNIPANAPHSFKNDTDRPARTLCLCSPAGQEEFFMAVGDRVDSRTAPPPKLSHAEMAGHQQRTAALAARYRTEMLAP